MPLASLDKENRGKYIHSPAHDLESLLHTALGIVTFTTGPCGQIRAPTDHVPRGLYPPPLIPIGLHRTPVCPVGVRWSPIGLFLAEGSLTFLVL